MGDLRLGERWTAAQRARNGAIYWAARVALGAVSVLPAPALRALGAVLGLAVAAVWGAARRRARQRLCAAFPQGAPVTPWQVFRLLGSDLGDTLALLNPNEAADASAKLTQTSEAVLRHASNGGRGAVFVTAHLGSIDRMAAVVASRGYRVATVARESYDPRFTALYERVRAPRGVRAIYRGRRGAELKIVRHLRAGSLVGFPMDLAGRGMQTTSCAFLGEHAELPVGPARLALRTGAALLVGTLAAGAGGELEIVVERIDHEGQHELELTANIAASLERRIRALPGHWVWMHMPPTPLIADR